MAPRSPKETQTKPAKTEKPAKAAKPKAAKVAAETPAAPLVETVVASAGQMKLKELIDSVAEKTGRKKPEVKAVVEATLAAVGEALASGKALVIPPLGKLRVVKNKGPALTLKLRLADGAKAAGLALADDGEDG